MSHRVEPVYWESTDRRWSSYIRALPHGSVVVLNRANGPGDTMPEPTLEPWADLAIDIRAHGSFAVGYVPMSHGARRVVDLELDIAKWEAWAGVDGIFCDEAPVIEDDDLPTVRDRLRTIYRRVHRRSTETRTKPTGFSFFNLGTWPDTPTVPAFEMLVLARELPGAVFCTYEGTPLPPEWHGATKARSAALLHHVARDAPGFREQLTNMGYGWVGVATGEWYGDRA